jgi:hypothetical protein
MLVGGTALAGFYAAHRRSDDLDLFVRNTLAFDQCRRRVRSLTQLGAKLLPQNTSPDFARALIRFRRHSFTIDVVVDENLFAVGTAHSAGDIRVASLQTLLMCKAATLVSRCSEKDLYDLWWLSSQGVDLTPEVLVQLGSQIDPGVEPESILISLAGASPSLDACDFALAGGPTAKTIHQRVAGLKRDLERSFGEYLERLPPPRLARSLRQLRRIK